MAKFADFEKVRDDVKEVKRDFKDEKNRAEGKRTECVAKFADLKDVPDLLPKINESLFKLRLFLQAKFNDAAGIFFGSQ